MKSPGSVPLSASDSRLLAPSAGTSPPAVLRVAAHAQGGRIARVEILDLTGLAAAPLTGRTVDEARRLVGAFRPGGQAHVAALTAACAAARGEPPLAGEAAVLREREVAAEAAQESLGRLLLDWPPLFGHTAPRHRYAHLHRRLGQLRDERGAFDLGGDLLDLLANELLSGFYRTLRGPNSLTEFVALARRGGAVGRTLADLIERGAYVPPEDACVPLLPSRSAAEWAVDLGGLPTAEFCRAPLWQGQAWETGPLPRRAGSPLVARLLSQGHRIAARLFARVEDLGDFASRLRHPLPADLPPLVDAAPLGPDCGLARVETAQGLLLHAVRLEGGRIAGHAIVTPAAWNFHPAGPVVREARGRPTEDWDLALFCLRALVLALDPGGDFEASLNGERPAHA